MVGGTNETEVNRAKASAALEPREQEVKAEEAKLLGGRRWVRVKAATVKRVTTPEDARKEQDIDAEEGAGGGNGQACV